MPPGQSVPTVREWRARFAAEDLSKFGEVRKVRGRKPSIPKENIDEIVRLTQSSKPEGQTHWSCRTMAEATGVLAARSSGCGRPGGSSPTGSRRSSSRTTNASRKSWSTWSGVHGPTRKGSRALYGREVPDPSARPHPALAADEERPCRHNAHDYKRNGTTTLFAALDVLSGKVIGQCLPHHTNNELLHFLKRSTEKCPKASPCTS